MAEGNGNDRINISRETLRAELSELKLDLIQRLASKAEVENLNQRVASIEMHGSPQMNTMLGDMHEFEKRLIEMETTSVKAEAVASFKRLVITLSVPTFVALIGSVSTLVWLAVSGH